MSTLEMCTLSEEELSGIVAEYAKGVLNKNEYVSHWHVLNVLQKISNEQRWPDQKDLPFIRECLLKKGIGKISELKEYTGVKEKPRIPFHMLSIQKKEDPRDTCPECDIHGNIGCPQHRDIIRNL